MFFRQPGCFEYSDKVIKYEINELKTNDEVLKVLVKSNYWKKYGPIEILVVFNLISGINEALGLNLELGLGLNLELGLGLNP